MNSSEPAIREFAAHLARLLMFRAAVRSATVWLLAVGAAAADAKWNRAELAAFTSVASTLLNLDEAITKE